MRRLVVVPPLALSPLLALPLSLLADVGPTAIPYVTRVTAFSGAGGGGGGGGSW